MKRRLQYRLYKFMPWLEKRATLIMELPNNALHVDLGCNVGTNLAGFKQLQPNVDIHACDRGDFRLEVEEGGATFHRVDLLKDRFPFADSSADLVTAMHIIEHLPDLDHLLREVRRILKPQGKLFIECPGVRSLFFPTFSWLNRRQEHTFNFFDDPTHLRPFSTTGLTRLLRQNGFEVGSAGISRNWLFTALSPVLILCGLVFPRLMLVGTTNLFGWSIYAIAKRVNPKP